MRPLAKLAECSPRPFRIRPVMLLCSLLKSLGQRPRDDVHHEE